ncbi:MAG: class I SAM-dependent methyltransferase [Bdellovibrionales bacterium]|nr:class I SAM-dependent methyltransferase [Bdellovibrionales bacterium]
MQDRLVLDAIVSAPYPDFVGLINQTNVPPGSLSTVHQWANYSSISSSSHIVEIACTTGFSLRELQKIAKCTGEGVDLSGPAIDAANRNSQREISSGALSFIKGDATVFSPLKRPTHIVVGGALGFFPDPKQMIDRLIGFFDHNGCILAAPFFARKPIPDDLLIEARDVLGITPTQISYKSVMSHYSGFRVLYEQRSSLVQETKSELIHYCRSTVARAMKLFNDDRPEVFSAIYDRLFQIRDVTNRLRPFQGFSVLVLEYDQEEYGTRYIELF